MADMAQAEPTLVDHVLGRLRKDIIDGTRPPGERLRIERMRSIYGVGPTPIREALQRLVADGIVIANGNRGFQVAPLDAGDFLDLNIARVEVELAALRLSIAKGDGDWEARVVAAAYALEKQDELLLRGELADLTRWETLNGRFHGTLVEACGSRWLLRHRRMIQEQCDRYRRASVYHDRMERNLLEEHRAIAAAVIARDAPRASALVKDHFNRTAEGLLRVLDAKS
jgi:GntR family transcriptional regulator, carbon starvation induced regulator